MSTHRFPVTEYQQLSDCSSQSDGSTEWTVSAIPNIFIVVSEDQCPKLQLVAGMDKTIEEFILTSQHIEEHGLQIWSSDDRFLWMRFKPFMSESVKKLRLRIDRRDLFNSCIAVISRFISINPVADSFIQYKHLSKDTYTGPSDFPGILCQTNELKISSSVVLEMLQRTTEADFIQINQLFNEIELVAWTQCVSEVTSSFEK